MKGKVYETKIDEVAYHATIRVKKKTLNQLEALLSSDVLDYEKLDIPEDTNIWLASVIFPDGCMVDIKVNSARAEDGYLWTEAVLFDKHGAQIAYSEVQYGIDGMWLLERTDSEKVRHSYEVSVKAMDERKGKRK